MVRMLCSRSASFTRMTRKSRDMAIAIFWKFSACASACDWKMTSSLETPSTISATSAPKVLARESLVTSVSSITSCITAAMMDW